MTEFSNRVVAIIQQIPEGRVISYGDAATAAGSPRSARQVARLLHSSSRSCNLPWHRVISQKGTIKLPKGGGFEEQMLLLKSEGIEINEEGNLDMERYRWVISSHFYGKGTP